MSDAVLFGITDPIARQHSLLGREALLEFRTSDAFAGFRRALMQIREVSEEEPGSFVNLRDLAICWDQMGAAHQQAGEVWLAYDAYDEAHDRFEALAKIEGEAGRSGRELARFLYRFAALAMQDENWNDAALLLERSHDVSLERLKSMPACAARLSDLFQVQQRLAVVRRRKGGL